ncbi:SDR family NAD(P)-dependent oxidoreductase [Amaricoccus sp.]|uniref:SDR family NAD(P)-dependent oxidoreductase n=1 Tax=Amaricoccus sp. TaxID=1872485 RepID=UPI001B507C1D|nr:SDR family NAD(P)-dependent oxidoreductase [Amaricoccus sp.]MBP7242886.1 SDR family oxidoreductase [Amaricoccus sp.]
MPLDVAPAPAPAAAFAGRTVLVSGAARGIGLAVATRFAEAGARVVIGDVLIPEGRAAAEALAAQGRDVRFTPLDVSDEPSWNEAAAFALEIGGRLDVLVNNAGIEITTLIADADPAAFRRLCDVNLTGVLLGMKTAFRAMRPGGAAGRGGAIVNVSSTAAHTAFPATGPYAATKAGVERLTKVGAVEAGRLGYGVRVNCVHPGVVATALSAGSGRRLIEMGLFPDEAELQAFMLAQTPLGRFGAPGDVAETVAFLASDAAAYVTGAGVPVAGGMGV